MYWRRKTIRKRPKLCSSCYCVLRRAGDQRYCLECHAAYMRENRPEYAQLSSEQKRRSNARAYANTYQRRGKFEREPCRDCGLPEAEKHHEDYSRPLEFIWLCRKCHLDLHLKRHVEPIVRENDNAFV